MLARERKAEHPVLQGTHPQDVGGRCRKNRETAACWLGCSNDGRSWGSYVVTAALLSTAHPQGQWLLTLQSLQQTLVSLCLDQSKQEKLTSLLFRPLHYSSLVVATGACVLKRSFILKGGLRARKLSGCSRSEIFFNVVSLGSDHCKFLCQEAKQCVPSTPHGVVF